MENKRQFPLLTCNVYQRSGALMVSWQLEYNCSKQIKQTRALTYCSLINSSCRDSDFEGWNHIWSNEPGAHFWVLYNYPEISRKKDSLSGQIGLSLSSDDQNFFSSFLKTQEILNCVPSALLLCCSLTVLFLMRFLLSAASQREVRIWEVLVSEMGFVLRQSHPWCGLSRGHNLITFQYYHMVVQYNL